MQPLLCGPGLRDDGGGRAALPGPQRVADERMMAIMPGGFDKHTPKMGVAGLGNPTLRALGTTRVFGGYQPDERHGAGRGAKSTRVAELRRDRQRGQIVDATEAPQALDPLA